MDAGGQLVLTEPPALLLEASVLLLLAILVSVFTSRLNNPLTVILAGDGMVSESVALEAGDRIISEIQIT